MLNSSFIIRYSFIEMGKIKQQRVAEQIRGGG